MKAILIKSIYKYFKANKFTMKKLLFLFTLSLGIQFVVVAQQDSNEIKQAKNLLQEKKYNEAIALLNKITTQAPQLLAPYYLKGLAYLQTNDTKQAIEAFNAALRKDPAHSGIYFYRALAKEAQGEDNEAMQDLETAILLRSDNPQYFYKLAKIQTKLKQYPEAKISYEQATRLAPANAQILEDRDKALAQMPADLNNNAFVSRTRGGTKDATTTNFENQIKQTIFTSLEEGKAMFAQINTAQTSASNKKLLLTQLRNKVMQDLYANKELFKEDIEELQYNLQTESWLMPDAMNFMMNLITNSPYWFAETIDCGNGVLYRYQVTKGREDKDYNLDVYMMRNEETHNIYYSNLRASTDAQGNDVFDIFVAQNKGYTWKILLGNYLRATSQNGQITYLEAGRMEDMKTDYLLDCLAKNTELLQPKENTNISMMKALVQNLILNYSLLFEKVE
jgi:tetratricopeptide (TPR) repeat protein